MRAGLCSFREERGGDVLLIHPFVQAAGIVLVLAAFLSGVQRFRSLHLHQRTSFPWRRHVLLGKAAFFTLLAGAGLGLGMVRYHWDQNLMTMGHGKTGLVILPLLLFGIVSGLLLDAKKAKGTVLKVLHGVNNTLVLLLVLNQLRTGLRVYRLFVSGL